MKICQVTPGLISIPPNGWGAVEKIIWQYHLNAIAAGHESEIKYLDEMDSSYDIVHIHVANLAIMAKERGIKYVFSLHDHHAFLYGKDSSVYRENLDAIANSEVSFVPAKFLIPYFNHHPKLKYFGHGVENDFFKPPMVLPDEHKLLCVANNGYANNQSSDRKGFSYAIGAAKILGLPITIAGPENNKNYFNANNIEYDKLTILYNLTEEELLKTYQSHTIFLHPSELEAGHPNLTLLEAMSCGLPVVGTYEWGNELPGLYRVDRDVQQVVDGIKSVKGNYNEYRKQALNSAEERSFKNVTDLLLGEYQKLIRKPIKITSGMRDQFIEVYEESTGIKNTTRIPTNSFHYSFVNGATVEIKGGEDRTYKIDFIDSDTNELVYSAEIKNNCWTKVLKEYCTNWLINVYHDNQLVNSHAFDPSLKRVYIAIESKAIGDTIAWFPILNEFKKKWDCDLIVSTFHNDWFAKTYPEIEFITPGEQAHGLYAMYTIGWYYDGDKVNYNKHRRDFKMSNLQNTACEILNLPPMEVKPTIDIKQTETNVKGKYIVIAPHASAHAKYWNNPDGWQKVIDHVKSLGYEVVMITQEKLGHKWDDDKIGGKLRGVIDKTGDIAIEDRMADILNSELFIGVGSGLSWISWALSAKTMLISGFSEPYTEFTDCIRIFTKKSNTCTGCFNKHKLDAGNWDWCPVYEKTPFQFECTKTIEPEQVITEINKILVK